jgi:uncharacterized protein YbjT (DUF2867 family)
MYVVTGATGNTGSVVANELLAKGQQVRVIGRNEDRLRPLAEKGAEPFVADLADQAALRRAFSGAKAVYAMIPPEMSQPDISAYQSRVGEAIAGALEQTAVQYAVSLSSIGADKPDRTGPVVGLHRFEQRLNRIPGLNVVHLRAGYFMENTLAQIGPVQALGIAVGPLDPNLKVPMIFTGDIGMAAAGFMLELFTGQQTRELQGQRDLSMAEAAEIIGRALEFTKLVYRQMSAEQIRPSFLEMGMSPDMADSLLEMTDALNSGYMRALEPRSARNTTPTSFETFVAKEFVPRCQKRPSAA